MTSINYSLFLITLPWFFSGCSLPLSAVALALGYLATGVITFGMSVASFNNTNPKKYPSLGSLKAAKENLTTKSEETTVVEHGCDGLFFCCCVQVVISKAKGNCFACVFRSYFGFVIFVVIVQSVTPTVLCVFALSFDCVSLYQWLNSFIQTSFYCLSKCASEVACWVKVCTNLC